MGKFELYIWDRKLKMAIGIVSDEELERELINSQAMPLTVIIKEQKIGRGEGKT